MSRLNQILKTLVSSSIMTGYSLGANALELRLPRPEKANSYEMIERSPQAFGLLDKYFLLLLRDQSVVVQTAYIKNDGSSTVLESSLTASRRVRIPSLVKSTDWIAGLPFGARNILIDGTQLSVTTLSDKNEIIRSDGIVWDLLKPASDPRGEPTRWEIASTRSEVSRLIKAKSGRKLSGVARLPPEWKGGKEGRFLLATNLDGYPLMQMDCQNDIGVSCMIVRSCEMESPIGSDDVRGIAPVPGRSAFLVGDYKKNALTLFKYSSCFQITKGATFYLPDQFKKLGSFGISQSGELWVVTLSPDDYTNGSVHVWPSSVWHRFIDPKSDAIENLPKN